MYSNLRHWDTQKLYGYDVEGNPFETSSDSHVHEEYKRENFFNINAYTNYDWQLNEKNNFHFMLGFQTENMKQTEFGLQRDGILIASMPEVDLTTGIGSDGKPATREGAATAVATSGITPVSSAVSTTITTAAIC